MSEFELVEIQFDPDCFETTLEDDFLLTRIGKELDAVTDIEQLREGAKKLLQLCVGRQAVIRGLCKRIGDLESTTIRRRYEN